MPAVDLGKGIKAGWAANESGWGEDMNANLRRLESYALENFAYDTELSHGLTYVYRPGVVFSGELPVRIPSGSVTLVPGITNYIERDEAGVVSANITGFTAGSFPMAKVQTDATHPVIIEDWRTFGVTGSLLKLNVSGPVFLDSPTQPITFRIESGFFEIGNPITFSMDPTKNGFVIEGDGVNVNLSLSSWIGNFSGASTSFVIGTSRGTKTAPVALLKDDTIFSLFGRGMHQAGSQFSGFAGARISIKAEENLTSTARGTYISFETTAPTTTSRLESIRITGDGDIDILKSGKGIYLRAPNATRYKLTVANDGTLSVVAG